MSERDGLRTWVEVDTGALDRNIAAFRALIANTTKLMAVVKSNAYGHGLWEFAKAAGDRVDWFGVDSFPEAVRLRREGIKKPILVLGYTLPTFFAEAARQDIRLTISTFESLRAFTKLNPKPKIHVKLDTGMYRQGFLPKRVPAAIRELKRLKLSGAVEGLYTHFASAKDRAYPSYTRTQLKRFGKACHAFEANGFSGFLRHASATGGTLLYPGAHFDMVRIGIGLYGLWPSRESRVQYPDPHADGRKPKSVSLDPILSWHTLVSEVKKIPAGAAVGYDCTERVLRPSTIAVLPVGYWHGFDRGLSSVGRVLVRGKRARILGRVSMDMCVVDVTGIRRVRPGDIATLIGGQGKEYISAGEVADTIGTTQYEIITRINPLIQRIYR